MDKLKQENAKLQEAIRRQSSTKVEYSSNETSSSRSSPMVEGLDMSVDSGYVRQCEIIERQKEKLKEEIDAANEFIRNQARELQMVSKENEDLKWDIQKFRNDEDRAEEILSKQRVEVEGAMKHAEELEMEVEELSRIKTDIEELNQSQANELLKFSQNDDKLKREIEWLKKSQKDMDDVRKSIQNELEKSKRNIDDLSKELDEKTDFIKGQVNEIDALKLKIIALEKELLEKQDNSSRAENEKLLDEYLRIQEELASLKQTNTKLSMEVNDLRKKWVQKEKESDVMVSNYAKENAELQDKMKILEKQAQSEIIRKSVTVVEHGQPLGDSAKLRELELKCADLQADVRSLRENCRRLQEMKEKDTKRATDSLQQLKEDNTELLEQVINSFVK